MNKPKLMASAKPNEHRVRVKRKVFVYSRIRKFEISDDKVYFKLMHQVAKITLSTVKEIVLKEKPKKVDWRAEFQRNKQWIIVNEKIMWRNKNGSNLHQ